MADNFTTDLEPFLKAIVWWDCLQ